MDGASGGCGCCGCMFAFLILPLILLVACVVIMLAFAAGDPGTWRHFNQVLPSMVSLLPL